MYLRAKPVKFDVEFWDTFYKDWDSISAYRPSRIKNIMAKIVLLLMKADWCGLITRYSFTLNPKAT